MKRSSSKLNFILCLRYFISSIKKLLNSWWNFIFVLQSKFCTFFISSCFVLYDVFIMEKNFFLSVLAYGCLLDKLLSCLRISFFTWVFLLIKKKSQFWHYYFLSNPKKIFCLQKGRYNSNFGIPIKILCFGIKFVFKFIFFALENILIPSYFYILNDLILCF